MMEKKQKGGPPCLGWTELAPQPDEADDQRAAEPAAAGEDGTWRGCGGEDTVQNRAQAEATGQRADSNVSDFGLAQCPLRRHHKTCGGGCADDGEVVMKVWKAVGEARRAHDARTPAS